MSLRIRRGGVNLGGGGGAPPTYGPIDGAQAVRDGVGARTVLDPGGGISFNSSGSLQAAINAAATPPVGQHSGPFVCSVNAPTWNSTVNTTTKRPDIIFPGPVGQKVININGGTFIPLQAGDGTVIRGGTWRQAATTFAAIITQNDCTVEDAVFTANTAKGLSVQGLNNLISHCEFTANGIIGFTAITGSHNLEVAYCRVWNNNTTLSNPGNEAGAHKILNSGNGYYHHNHIDGNTGFGAWWDTDNYDWLIEENVFENSSMSGFFWEANYGSVIRRNFISNNGRNVAIGGFPATLENTVNVRMSDNKADVTNPNGVVTPVQFTRNIIDHTGAFGGETGALILMWDHSATALRHVGNNDVFENQFWIRFSAGLGTRGVSRIRGQDTATSAYPVWTLDNNFFTNDYHVPVGQTGTAFWMWDSGTGQGTAKTYTQWQTFHTSDNLPLQVF